MKSIAYSICPVFSTVFPTRSGCGKAARSSEFTGFPVCQRTRTSRTDLTGRASLLPLPRPRPGSLSAVTGSQASRTWNRSQVAAARPTAFVTGRLKLHSARPGHDRAKFRFKFTSNQSGRGHHGRAQQAASLRFPSHCCGTRRGRSSGQGPSSPCQELERPAEQRRQTGELLVLGFTQRLKTCSPGAPAGRSQGGLSEGRSESLHIRFPSHSPPPARAVAIRISGPGRNQASPPGGWSPPVTTGGGGKSYGRPKQMTNLRAGSAKME